MVSFHANSSVTSSLDLRYFFSYKLSSIHIVPFIEKYVVDAVFQEFWMQMEDLLPLCTALRPTIGSIITICIPTWPHLDT